jgi:hypothetical protein
MTASIRKLFESFPHLHIPAIEGPPNDETITDVILLLNANAASILLELGGRNYGHLALTISAASYGFTNPFIPPINNKQSSASTSSLMLSMSNGFFKNSYPQTKLPQIICASG